MFFDPIVGLDYKSLRRDRTGSDGGSKFFKHPAIVAGERSVGGYAGGLCSSKVAKHAVDEQVGTFLQLGPLNQQPAFVTHAHPFNQFFHFR
jgi:hypothetical protein